MFKKKREKRDKKEREKEKRCQQIHTGEHLQSKIK